MNLDYIFSANLVGEDEIDAIIREHWLAIDYRINDDRSIDVFGDVKFPEFASFLRELPLQFNKIIGDFDCSALVNLTTLKGSPFKVLGSFNCGYTNIKSLEFAPKKAEKLIFDNTIKSIATNSNCDFKQVHMLLRDSNPVHGLPSIIFQHIEYLPTILKYQNYFEVWNEDYSFNKSGFENLIAEIDEGLQ